MSIIAVGSVFESQLWPQGDARDPLGVWGLRVPVTGDASGGSIKVEVQVPAAKRAAFVYTCYSVNIAKLAGLVATESAKVRLLTNWPNVDAQEGVQGYSSLFLTSWSAPLGMSSPIGGLASTSPLQPNDRFILLYDPSPSNAVMVIVELEVNDNVLAETWSFEAYGYYWDRSVMNTPGGPRHPGAS